MTNIYASRELDLSRIYSVSGRPVSTDWIQFGEHSYYANRLEVASWKYTERLIIGKYCSIADRVVLFVGGNRHTNFAANYPIGILGLEQRKPHNLSRSHVRASHTTLRSLGIMKLCLQFMSMGPSYLSTKNTTIGNDVWIGFGSMVLGGVSIGDGAVVAARSVVASDVPPYALVAGNPARVKKFRFTEKTVQRMLRIRWWDWPEERIRENLNWFYRPISEFVERFDPL